jgi:membrane protease subunit HflC
MIMNKKWIIAAAILVILVVVLANSVYVVKENQYACRVQFSKIVETTDEAGLHFKIPFVDTVKYFSKATTLYDIPPSEVLTSDKQNMTVDCYILWKISDPLKFYQTLGSSSVAEERLNALTYNELKTVMGTLAQADIINMEDGGKRNEIYDSIAADVDELAKTYGIHIVDVKIKQFDLPDSNLQAVYSRMISERNQIAEMHSAQGDQQAALIRNEVDKKVNIMISDAKADAAELEAEGEAEYMRLLAEAYDSQDKKDFYEFTLALDALKKSLTGDEKTVILDANSELAQILMGGK